MGQSSIDYRKYRILIPRLHGTTGCTTSLTTGCIHDTAGCQTCCQTGLTTGWMLYTRYNRLPNRFGNWFDNSCIV